MICCASLLAPPTLSICLSDHLCINLSVCLTHRLSVNLSVFRVEKKERARLKTVKFNSKSRDRGVSDSCSSIYCTQSN